MKLKQGYWMWRDDNRALDCAVSAEVGAYSILVTAMLLFVLGLLGILWLATLALSVIWVIPFVGVYVGYAIFCELTIGLGALRLGWGGFAHKSRLRKFILEKVRGR